jgi:hypothetical protein
MDRYSAKQNRYPGALESWVAVFSVYVWLVVTIKANVKAVEVLLVQLREIFSDFVVVQFCHRSFLRPEE